MVLAMRTVAIAFVTLVSTGACATDHGSSRAATPAAAVPAPAGFVFDWSPPCRVPVVEDSEIDGDLGRLKYVIDARRGADGNLEVRMQDFEMLRMSGQDVTSPAWKARLAPTMALTEAIPAMRVSPAGSYLGAEDPGALLERLLAARHYSPEEEAAVRKMLLSSGAAATFDSLIGEYWHGWVEDWIGWSLAPGASRDEKLELPVEGGTVPTTIRYEYVGLHDGNASLRLTSTVTGAQVFRLSGMKVGDMDKLAALIADARREQVAAVEIDPATLRPRHTRSELEVTVSFKDGTSKHRSEVHDLTWDWAKADGCGKPAASR
jgi:hypothetical protein